MLPHGSPPEDAQATRCLMASTPGANMHPMPPRPRLRAGMYPICEDASWSAPQGVRPMPTQQRPLELWHRSGKRVRDDDASFR
eukprot:7074440-Prymnesium_polylepis.1